jgi:hypothetical protein
MGLQHTERASCTEWDRLYDLFVSALGDVIDVEQAAETPLEKHSHAVHAGPLEEAMNRSKRAKEALLRHLRAHADCGLEQPGLVPKRGASDVAAQVVEPVSIHLRVVHQ